jgi:hypothetical protein
VTTMATTTDLVLPLRLPQWLLQQRDLGNGNLW